MLKFFTFFAAATGAGFFDQFTDWATKHGYLAIVGIVAGDGVFPLFPGETVIVAGGTLALKSEARLRTIIKDEIRKDAELHGDKRRSPLIARGVAQALSQSELISSEPVTLVLSEKGWVRSAKGHDVDAAALSYREGDSLLAAVRGRSTQQVAFFDSEGRAYTTPAHSLPSARGNGEPLTGRFAPAAGARFDALVAAENDSKIVIATHHGYGFVTRFESLVSRQKSGKAMVSLTDHARVLQPAVVDDSARDRIVVVTTSGHILMFSVAELPELDKGGKGNKLIEIPKAKLGTEQVAGIAVVPEGGEVIIWSNGRKLSRKWSDLVEVGGARATRGQLLPRGYTKVEGIERA